MSKHLCFRDDQQHDQPPIETRNEIALPPEVQPGVVEKEDEKEPPRKRARFEINPTNNDSNWELSQNLVDYVHQHMQEHIPPRDLKEGIMEINPIPTNIRKVPELDNYIKNTLQENTKHTTLKNERVLKNIQDQMVYILGPLSRLWAVVDQGRDMQPEDEALTEMGDLFEQTVLLTGQLFNTLSYHRRENILSTIIDSPNRVRDMLKEQSKELNETSNSLLFGDSFEDKLLKESKSIKKTTALFTGLKPKSQMVSNANTSTSSKQLPFRRGPLSSTIGKGRGLGFWKQARGGRQGRGKSKLKFFSCTGSVVNESKIARVFRGIKHFPKFSKSTSPSKRPVQTGIGTKSSSGRKSEILCRKLESTYPRPSGTRICSGISNSIYFNTSPTSRSSFTSNVLQGKNVSGSRNRGHAGKESNKTLQLSLQKSFPKQYISGSEKGLRAKASNKSETTQQAHTLFPFQNGKHLSVERITSAGRSDVQDRLEGRLLFSPSTQGLTEFCKFSMERKAVSVSLSLFRPRPSPQGLHKIDEDTSRPFKKAQHSSDCVLGRFFDSGKDCQRNRDSKGYSDFLTSTFRVYNKPKKVSSATYTVDSIFGSRGRLFGDEIEPSQREIGNHNVPMPTSINIKQSNSERIVSTSGSSVISGSGSSTGSFAIQGNAETKDFRTFVRSRLRFANQALSRGKDGVGMVDPESLPFKWTFSSSTATTADNRHRCVSPRLGCILQRSQNGGQWSALEKTFHINVLELKAVKLAILSFHRIFPNTLSVHIRIDNITALTYLKKMGGTKSAQLTHLSKQIWEYLLQHQITITVEYLPGRLNVEADTMSRNVRDSSEWKLDPQVFWKICKARWRPCTDLFASRLSHQVPLYFSWKIDPYSRGQDALQTCWTHLRGYAFPPFSLISRVLWKVRQEEATILLITPAWQTQAWYPQLLYLSIRNPILLPVWPSLLKNPQGENHPLLKNRTLRLVVWTISGKNCKQKEFRRRLQSLSLEQEGQVQQLITNRPGVSGVAGVVGERLIPFDVL